MNLRLLCSVLLLGLGYSLPVAAQTGAASGTGTTGSRSGVHGFGYEAMSVTNFETAKSIRRGALTLREKWFATDRMKQGVDATGTTIIECAVARQGTIETQKVVQSSGDSSLDAAASAAVAGASFAGLPHDFKGTRLRMLFWFNQPPAEDRPACNSRMIAPAKKVGGPVLAPRAKYAPDPEYSDEARRAKYQGTMLLGLTVAPDGTSTDVCILQGLGMGLDERAMTTVQSWRFEPATENGNPVPVRVSVEVSFALY